MKEVQHCDALRHADHLVDCYKMGQWHEFTTVVREDYEVPSSDAQEKLMRSTVRVVCAKCGTVIDPYTKGANGR